jgi:hypothetical protein
VAIVLTMTCSVVLETGLYPLIKGLAGGLEYDKDIGR